MMRMPLCLACLSLASCATRIAQQPLPPAPLTVEAEVRLTQQGFGPQAHFAYCIAPICPEVTPKLLPSMGTVPGAETTSARFAPNAATSLDAAPSVDDRLRASVLFASNQASLSTEATQRLNALLGAMPATAHLIVTGYTDSTGARHANNRVAHARAHAVVTYLHSQTSLSPDRIEVHARGRCCYIAPNQTAEGRARNRRTEVVVAPPAPRSL